MTHVHQPIPISGEGDCEITEAGLVVRGFKAASSIPTFLSSVAGMALAVGIVWKLVPEASVQTVVSSIATGGLIGMMGLRLRPNHKRPIERCIPWKCIRKVAIVDAEVQVLVKRQRPSGMLYFRPSADLQSFAAQVLAAKERYELNG